MAGTLLPRAMAATARGTCALDAQGGIHCWGLARLSTSGWTVPQGPFVALFSSIDAVCAVRADGTFTCFPEPLGTPNDLSYIPDVTVRELAVGFGAFCGIAETGDPFCNWVNETYAIPVPPAERFDHISVGERFACGIRDADGTILCWGSEGSGAACDYTPQAGQLLAPDGSFVELSSRTNSSCAVSVDGSLACWGAGGPADDPQALICDVPYNFGQSIPPDGDFVSVTVGDSHACGIRADGTVACWGAGTTDQGCSSTVLSFHCGQSQAPPGRFEQLALGNVHTCAMRADRTVQCWGWEGDGDGRTIPPPEFQ